MTYRAGLHTSLSFETSGDSSMELICIIKRDIIQHNGNICIEKCIAVIVGFSVDIPMQHHCLRNQCRYSDIKIGSEQLWYTVWTVTHLDRITIGCAQKFWDLNWQSEQGFSLLSVFHLYFRLLNQDPRGISAVYRHWGTTGEHEWPIVHPPTGEKMSWRNWERKKRREEKREGEREQ